MYVIIKNKNTMTIKSVQIPIDKQIMFYIINIQIIWRVKKKIQELINNQFFSVYLKLIVLGVFGRF